MTSDPVFNVIDIISFVLIIVGSFVGYQRKLSGEIAILISLGAAFFLGVFMYEPIGLWLVSHTRMDVGAARVATYVFLVLGAGVVMVAARILLGKFMKLVIGEQADRTCGAVAGFVKAVVVVLIIYFAMNVVPFDYVNRKFGYESFIGRNIQSILPSIEEVGGEVLR